jgi:hypothetical protein
MLALLKIIDARFSEPSTYAGISAMLLALNINLDPGVMHQVTLYGTVGAGVLAILLNEIGNKSPAVIASDMLGALVAAIKAMPTDATTVTKTVLALMLAVPMLALSACGIPPAQQTAAIAAGQTLVSIAAANNTTVASVLAQGALICGKATSIQGQLALDGLVAIANAAGAPVAVTGMLPKDVSNACTAVGLIAGPMPVGADPASVAVAVVPTVLPPVVVAAK